MKYIVKTETNTHSIEFPSPQSWHFYSHERVLIVRRGINEDDDELVAIYTDVVSVEPAPVTEGEK